MPVLFLWRNRDVHHFQRNHFTVFDTELVVIFQDQIHKFCAVNAANDRGVIQVFLRIFGLVGQCHKEAIISFAHSAFQRLDGSLFDVSILAFDLDNNAGRQLVFIGGNVDATIPTMRG